MSILFHVLFRDASNLDSGAERWANFDVGLSARHGDGTYDVVFVLKDVGAHMGDPYPVHLHGERKDVVRTSSLSDAEQTFLGRLGKEVGSEWMLSLQPGERTQPERRDGGIAGD